MRVFGSSFFHSLPSVFVFQLAFVWLLVADFFRSRSGQSGSWGRGVCKLQLPAGAVVGFFLGWYWVAILAVALAVRASTCRLYIFK